MAKDPWLVLMTQALVSGFPSQSVQTTGCLPHKQSPDSNVRSQGAQLKRTDRTSQAPLQTGAAWRHSPARR